MKKRLKFPSIKEVARAIKDEKNSWRMFSNEEIGDDFDVRLQVYDDGSWCLHTGDASYDQDHRGYWGASSIDKRTNSRELAADLIDQCRDHYAQCED